MAPGPRTKSNSKNFDNQGSFGDNSTSDDDVVVVAVMGNTGSGKSSFIQLLSGNASVKTSDSLHSETIDVQCVDFVDEETGRNVILVDTPGFDDSRDGITDTDILKRITNFLLQEYDNKRKLNGIIYIHSIASTRFGGQSVRNLTMFKNLCGAETYKNVVILTTFWDDKSSRRLGESREAELKTNFCLKLAQGGAAFMRHNRTKSSAQQVLRHILNLAPTDVQITKEIRVEGKALQDTAAGAVQKVNVDALIAKQKAEVAELHEEIKTMKEANDEIRSELAKQKAEMQIKIDRLEKERTELFDGLASERKARKVLDDTIQQERNDRIKQEQDWKNRSQNEEEPVNETWWRTQSKGWSRVEPELEEDIPVLPNLLRNPVFSGFDFDADMRRANTKATEEKSTTTPKVTEEKWRTTQFRSWGRFGPGLEEEVPVFPNFLGMKPVFGGLDFGMEMPHKQDSKTRDNMRSSQSKSWGKSGSEVEEDNSTFPDFPDKPSFGDLRQRMQKREEKWRSETWSKPGLERQEPNFPGKPFFPGFGLGEDAFSRNRKSKEKTQSSQSKSWGKFGVELDSKDDFPVFPT
ncbi:hypothetical protein D9757_005041 [Collybiopsis confluens]|uniref:G domain-containing protein n=1 Tax=Collybiopsis confluens TaxID=2823264 RepID=A0A8H5HST9_9AGAR|nr:hypothetical protein D9757_005041 [Collybiopsis confluens]